ncbi:MAG TPA: IclR family transcriptional regulator [Beijerinckiaceae bacterium]|nr:IclR family transcriptional regulator [Beijerinckiaceae bacterium]
MNQSAVKRALALLEHLAGRPAGQGVTVLADELALPKSIAHRLLGVLAETGYVRQDAETGRYALTLKLTTLGLRHYVRTGLDDLAQPLLDRLAAETGELARLAVVDGERLVWVAKAQGAPSGLRYDPDIDHDTGHEVVLHATATGKAWLATLPDPEALRIVEATGLRTPARFGANVARTLPQFRRLLAQTRDAGHGEAIEEGEPGTAAVAVAVRETPRGAAVATLSLAGPVVRFGPERRAALAARLRAAADELGAIWPLRARLGGRTPIPNGEIRHERDHSAAL